MRVSNVWIQIRPDVLLALICVQTFCKSYHQTTLVETSCWSILDKTIIISHLCLDLDCICHIIRYMRLMMLYQLPFDNGAVIFCLIFMQLISRKCEIVFIHLKFCNMITLLNCFRFLKSWFLQTLSFYHHHFSIELEIFLDLFLYLFGIYFKKL